MRNLHNVERRASRTYRPSFLSGHPYIGYGKRDNFYIARAVNRRDGWIGRGFIKGTMSETHLIRAATLTALSDLIAAQF